MGAFCIDHASVARNEPAVVRSGNMLETLTLKELYAPVRDNIDAVSARVGDFWTKALQLVHGPSMPSVQAGGKMLRPALCLLAAGVSGAPDTRRFVNLATGMELLHLAALAHDDVIDRASFRRGMHTLNARWDDHAAILAGDYLVARSIEIMTSYNSASVISTAIRSIREMAEAELKCFANGNEPMTEQDVLEVARKKTASLFASACSAPALLLGEAQVQTLHDYGMALGIAFQIVDDLLDITATDEQLGKPAGHDMVQGVYTLPVLRTLQAGGVAAMELLAVLGKPLDTAERDKALAIVRSNGGVEASLAIAHEWCERAEGACNLLPASPATEVLRATPAALLATL